MERFSEREGIIVPKKILQIEEIDDDLRNSLWNAIKLGYWDRIILNNYHHSPEVDILLKKIWIFYFKNRLDEIPGDFYHFNQKLKKFFFNAKWYEVYDFVEFLPNTFTEENINTQFIKLVNSFLEKELSGYRFVDKKLVGITSEVEISSIENALRNESINSYVKKHLAQALSLLSNRENPDYRNSIKESISAVESYFNFKLDDNNITLGQALKKIDNIHPSLIKGFSNIYGYTSSADGIRHGLLEEDKLQQEDASFMLIACSAFINYLTQKKINSKS